MPEGWDAPEGWGTPAGPHRRDDPGGAEHRNRSGRGAQRAVRARLPLWDRALRGLAGVLAGGLVVLSLVLLGVWLLAGNWGVPGPGGFTVFWHVVGAVVGVAGQRVADRRPDRTGSVAAAVVVGAAALVLGLAWFL
ncbi:hypothetical protein [Pseudonocardia sp. KRD291]|uniref:hypothetical protein n=1 Tax=Pseudonocardia sp. KRD291 TaxID=2792007 RepID=UPI001C4A4BAD|nr:hypothetical protein [Pseudonocardia sp. KRD291]MBW0101717.1 hypothetical protein [Pseudonocardia sp. KRD291]